MLFIEWSSYASILVHVTQPQVAEIPASPEKKLLLVNFEIWKVLQRSRRYSWVEKVQVSEENRGMGGALHEIG